MPCSNPRIFDEASSLAEREGFECHLRENYGGGEGALWWLQSESGAPIREHRYVWYHEESCEPIREGWIVRMLQEMDTGAPLVGWWWNPVGRRRRGAIPHAFAGTGGRKMIAYENTQKAGYDDDGKPFWGLWDTPGFRHESLLVRSDDFLSFQFPDARDPSWLERNGVRTYGIKAERNCWDLAETCKHGFRLPSPNLQWHIMRKYDYVPRQSRGIKWLFRELPDHLRKDEAYLPSPPRHRLLREALARTVLLPSRLRGRLRELLKRERDTA